MTPMRQQYHVRSDGNGTFDAWNVNQILKDNPHLPVIDVPLADLGELDEDWWFQAGDTPSPRAIAQHIQLVRETELRYPILLCADGRLMDGMHRAVKALAAGHTHIKAVKLPVTPPPDYANVKHPSDLLNPNPGDGP